MVKEKHTITFLIWLALFNWPPILMWVPFLRMVCFLPVLFWINVPTLWLGLAKAVGMPHYDVQEFGAMPQTVFAWMLIVAFWILVSLAMTAVTTYVLGWIDRTSAERTHATHEPTPRPGV